MAGGVRGAWGCAWPRGHAWQGGMHGRGLSMAGETATAEGGHI